MTGRRLAEKFWLKKLGGEEGATLVETAIAFSLMLAILFGLVVTSFALYTYHYLSAAAREATRYAIVRGSNSCSSSGSALANCNMGPDTNGQKTLQAWVSSRGYPGIDGSKITVQALWYSESTYTDSLGNPVHQWITLCSSGDTCNDPGNMVKVTVQYAFPFSIPFWKATTLNMSSTSSLVISN